MRLTLFHSIKNLPEVYNLDGTIKFRGLTMSIREYVNMAVLLCNSKQERESVAEYQDAISRKYMSNPLGMYEDFSRYIKGL